MGLIKAAVSSISSTLGDTWKDYFCCDSMPPNVLMMKATRKSGKGSSNKKGNENIITTGSVIVVNEGQCMIIVDQGQIVEVCAVPGEYTYDASTEPSIFVGGFNGIKETFKTIGKRFTFGGTAAHDQCIYYFNMKEITDNKFGTPTAVPFRVSYQDIGRSFTVGLRCNGIYSYKIADPLLFYKNVCGNSASSYTREQLDNTLYSEFMAQLAPAFAKISSTVRYDELNTNTLAITNAMKEIMTAEWRNRRGIEICSVAIRSVSIPKEDEDKIKQYEDMAWNRDAGNAAAKMVESQAQALRDAANNRNGAAMGFYGMNMAQQMGGLNAQNLYDMAARQQNADSWNCSCGTVNTAKFCANCGKPKPTAAGSWSCSCGTQNSGKFCANCGKPNPADGWTCSCSAVNKGKFCSECGKPKPADAPLYKCDKCGWEPDDPMNPPKFCANCGDPFNEADIVK
ncbi:MAG: SPFH domain-containing protein [Ruminococcus sp.]|nr:SPFH domain-containing protein [Ruminococcus sp.]MDE6784989.1 SPFH domain-containing protein [Ruminococcus sp.]